MMMILLVANDKRRHPPGGQLATYRGSGVNYSSGRNLSDN